MIGLGLFLPHMCFINKLSSCTVSEIEPVRTIENKALTFFLAFLAYFFFFLGTTFQRSERTIAGPGLFL